MCVREKERVFILFSQSIWGYDKNFIFSIVELASIDLFGEGMVPQEGRGYELLSSTFLSLSHR